MKILIATAAAAAALACAVPAAAQVSGSIGYTHVDGDPVSLGAVTGRVGWSAPNGLGVEGEASVGVKDDDYLGASFELKHQLAAYGVYGYNFTNRVRGFVRAGYGETKLEGTSAGTSVSATGHSFNYGVGAEFGVSDRDSIRLDYTRADFTDNNGEADTFGISYARKF